MSDRLQQAAIARWQKRSPTSGLVWADHDDVTVSWQRIGDEGHLRLSTSALLDDRETSLPKVDHIWLASTSFDAPLTVDEWMVERDVVNRVLHLNVNSMGVQKVHCHWELRENQALAVVFHMDAHSRLAWYDHHAWKGAQHAQRIWDLGEGAHLNITNVIEREESIEPVVWDDVWTLEAQAQVIMVEHVGEQHDVRRRSTVFLAEDAAWHMATVGWLLPQRWHEHDLNVLHEGARSTSRMHHRTALLDRTQRRMTSCVRLETTAHAGHTEQTMQHWLLSERAVLAASPQLAIGVGSVKVATHGAAVGQFEAKAIQAMQARGLPLSTVLTLLLEGALVHALDLLDDGQTWWNEQREVLHQRVHKGIWLDGAQAFLTRQMEVDDER